MGAETQPAGRPLALSPTHETYGLVATEHEVAARLNGLEVDHASLAVVSNLYRAALAVRKHVERAVLAEHGLTWTGWVVLWIVWVHEEAEVSHAAVAAGLSRATLTGVQQTLVAKGFVQRRPHPDDRRKFTLSVTRSGDDLMADLIPAFNSVESWVTQDLDACATGELAASLRALVKHTESGSGTRRMA